MTKAELLKHLARVPMNARVEFEVEGNYAEPARAFVCMGHYGLTLVLTDGTVPPLECEPEESL